MMETHTDRANEVDWGWWWTGCYRLSHGSNLSAGVAVLISPSLDLRLALYTEIIPGRLMAVRAEIQGISFVLVNVYAPNEGSGRLVLFQKLSSFVQQCEQDECVVLRGRLELHHELYTGQDGTGAGPPVSCSVGQAGGRAVCAGLVEGEASPRQTVHLGEGLVVA